MPAENIIVMSYDDAANSKENKFPGKLFNKPSSFFGGKSVDVREGCVIDYASNSVSIDTFEAVLTGDSEYTKSVNGSGRVLQSTSSDNVFLNFVDHGGVHIIAFPNNNELLHAKKLNQILTDMHQKKMYKNLVFYMEACESGSMFEDLSDSMNIFAMTASNAKESSWGTYCPPTGDFVHGRKLGTCLGDLFSVNWMEETDKYHNNEAKSLTIQKQYNHVKMLTNKSHVMIFGDESFMTDDVNDFEGNEAKSRSNSLDTPNHDTNVPMDLRTLSAVDSRDIRLNNFYYRYIRATEIDEKEMALKLMMDELSLRSRFDRIFAAFKEKVRLGSGKMFAMQCYANVRAFFEKECQKPDEHDYVMKYYGLLEQACANGHEEEIRETISALCSQI